MSSAKELALLDALASRELIKNLQSLEIVGKDEAIVAGEYSASGLVTVDPNSEVLSGRLLNMDFISYVAEGGTGQIQTPKFTLFMFREDPTIALGDVSMGANGVNHKNVVGQIEVKTNDWTADADGAVASILVDIPYSNVTNLFCVIILSAGSDGYNNAAGDDEILEMNICYSAGSAV